MGLGNDVVQRRMLSRHRGVLGDYVASLPNQIISNTSGVAQGPTTSPTIPPTAPTDNNSLLQQIVTLLQNMPVALSDEFRTRFIIQPRESVAFIVPGENVAVPNNGLPTVIAQFKMNQGFTGFLTHVGVNVSPATAFPSVTWQIRINNNIHPNFANRVFNADTLSTPTPFAFELVQSRTVQLIAINPVASGGSVDCSGVLVGWTEFMASYKSYGAAPQSGIA